MAKPPDDIIVLAIRAISGEVTNNMRLIAFAFGDNCATFRFYCREEPSEDEIESGEVVATNFDAGLGAGEQLKSLNVEFVVSSEPFGKLDSLDFGLFRRWEE